MDSDDSQEGTGRVLGEEWFPVGEVSVESMRERIPGIDYPPTNRIHVWFARRPLIASRAAIASSLFPVGIDRRIVLKTLAIPHDRDVVGAHEEVLRAKAEKRKIKSPFDWPQAYKVPIGEDIHRMLQQSGIDHPVILDPFSGGGSIPLEATRLGLDVVANDLNPVAYFCLKGTVEYPARFGTRLIPEVRAFCEKVHREAKAELEEYYPSGPHEEVYSYLWARTIRCPQCGLTIPLSPNWWIARTDKNKTAIRVISGIDSDTCTFEILEDPENAGYDPDCGTVSKGDAICPRCTSTIDGDAIKMEAQAGGMGHQLYCVCTKIPRSRGRGKTWVFRAPTEDEMFALDRLGDLDSDRLTALKAKGLIPPEEIIPGSKTREPINYGMPHWSDLFNPRQLLAHATYMEKYLEAKQSLFSRLSPGTDEWEFATAVATYGAMVFDSCVNYNSIQGRWHSGRTVIVGAMDMQAFPFRWSYGEFDHARMLWPWAVEKTIDSLTELIALMPETSGNATIINADAQALPCEPKSIDVIVTDPPYSNNVMYAEVSDFFYVWLKRLVGDLFPVQFSEEQTNKTDEAVANPARFKGIKKGQAKNLADQDYAAKMEASFREMHRVLKDDGVLCVMFTHRKAEAWEGLAEALMNAGFSLQSSWPVHTEPGEKFGKANKGALKVTVLLYCRKREDHRPGRWEDVVEEIRHTASYKVEEYSQNGITGPDLLVSVYGPALGKFSEYYPVKDVTGAVRGVGDALAIVAQVVNEYLTGDVQGADMETLAYLNLLRIAHGLTLEYDLARVSTVFGGNTSLDAMDVKGGSGLVKKTGSKVKILTAKQRFAEGVLDPHRPQTFGNQIDVVHAALILYEQEGLRAVSRILEETGKDTRDAGIISVLQAITTAGEGGSADLVAEARIASALLEALGQTPSGVGRSGERITHWI